MSKKLVKRKMTDLKLSNNKILSQKI